jgi:hypothetical protein
MAYYSSGSSLLNDVMPQLKQFRATTGRDMSPQVIQGLLQAKIKADNEEASKARALDLQQTQIENQQSQAQQKLDADKKAAKAASLQGLLTLPASLSATGKATKELYKFGTGLFDKPPVNAGAGTDVGFAAGGEATAAEGGTGLVTGAAPTAGIAGVDTTTGLTAPGALTAPGYTTPTLTTATTFGDTTGGLLGASTVAETAPVAAGVAGAAETGGAAIGVSEAAQLAAYDEALAAGAAEGVGTAGATTAGATSLGSTLSTVAGPAAIAGTAGAFIANKLGLFGADHPDTGAAYAAGTVGGAVAGAIAGAAATSWSGPGAIVGAIVGGIVGAVSSSVICSELLRQGIITEQDRQYAYIFRQKYISDEMFEAYLIWAVPYVEIMQRGGKGNEEVRPRMEAFVSYMIKMGRKHLIEPTEYEKEVYNSIWDECLIIAAIQAKRKAA